MRVFQIRLAVLLLVIVHQYAAAFQNGGISTRRSSAFAPRQRPLQAAFISDLTNVDLALATQSVTGGFLCGVGDAMAQVKERLSGKENTFDFTRINGNSIDVERVFRFALKGLGGSILWSLWYGLADEWSLMLSKDVLNVLGDDFGDGVHPAVRTVAAILLEQFIACPIIYGLWDIPFPMVMNGSSPSAIRGQVQEKIGPLLVENAKVWSFVNILIYNIPVEYRVFAMGMADMFWQSVISSVTADAVASANGKSTNEDFVPEMVCVQTNAAEQPTVVARLTE